MRVRYSLVEILFVFFVWNMSFAGTRALTVNVRDYGASGDGHTLDTGAIHRAIEDCSRRGGGTVRFPAGTYLTGSLHLKSHVALQIEKGAVILGAPNDINAYDPAEPNPWGQYQDFGHSHFHDALMWGEHLEDVTISGSGTIDGGGITRSDPDPGGGDKAIALKLCKDITIRELTIKQGGHFAVLANGCTDMSLLNLTIRTPRDGIDLMGCSNVLIDSCDIRAIRYEDGKMAGGDDAIGIKSDYALGRKVNSEHIIVKNCFLSSGCNTLQFGSETVGDFRDIHFSNCVIDHADKAGIGITSNDGAIIEDVSYTDIRMTKTANPIFILVTGRGRAPNHPPAGVIRNVTFRNITAEDCYGYIKDRKFTSTISGLPGHPIEHIVFNNVKITYKGGGTRDEADIQVPYPEEYSPRHLGVRPASGFYIRHARDIQFHNVAVGFEQEDLRPPLVLKDVRGITLEQFTAQGAPGDSLVERR